MTIGKRILINSGFLCLVLAGVSLFAVNRLLNLSRVSKSIVEDSLPGVINSAAINAGQAENQIRMFRLLRCKTAEDRHALEQEMAKISEEINAATKRYEDAIVADEDRRLFEEVGKRREEYLQFRVQYFAMAETNAADATTLLDTTGKALYVAYNRAASGLTEYNARNGESRGTQLAAQVALSTRVIGIVAVVSLLVGVGVSLWSARLIAKVLSEVSSNLSDGANQVGSAASQVSAASQSLAEGASEQAASLEETSSSLEEMSSMTKRNADSALKAKELANQTRQAADIGARDMEDMMTAMDALKTASGDIAKIVKTIDEIAFQTNILALNAAVEAARAGEAGMGFAVVADEVRNLAQRSAQAAKETADKIEGAIAKTEQGVLLSGKVAQGLQEIVAKVRTVDELVASVAAASTEQTQGIDQVNTAVTQMDKVTQANAANAEESASAAEELNMQAETLQSMVAKLLLLVGGGTGQGAQAPSHAHRLSLQTEARTPRPSRNGSNHRAPAPARQEAQEPALAPASGSRSTVTAADERFRDF